MRLNNLICLKKFSDQILAFRYIGQSVFIKYILSPPCTVGTKLIQGFCKKNYIIVKCDCSYFTKVKNRWNFRGKVRIVREKYTFFVKKCWRIKKNIYLCNPKANAEELERWQSGRLRRS